jgi:hypothetical protein
MPKNANAIVSTNQIAAQVPPRGIISKNEASIPIPHTMYITFLFFLFGVISPLVLVNKNKELKANKPKNKNAHALCSHPLTPGDN